MKGQPAPSDYEVRRPKLSDEGLPGLVAGAIGLVGYIGGLLISPEASPAMAGVTCAFAAALASKAAMFRSDETKRNLAILEVATDSTESIKRREHTQPHCYFMEKSKLHS